MPDSPREKGKREWQRPRRPQKRRWGGEGQQEPRGRGRKREAGGASMKSRIGCRTGCLAGACFENILGE